MSLRHPVGYPESNVIISWTLRSTLHLSFDIRHTSRQITHKYIYTCQIAHKPCRMPRDKELNICIASQKSTAIAIYFLVLFFFLQRKKSVSGTRGGIPRI